MVLSLTPDGAAEEAVSPEPAPPVLLSHPPTAMTAPGPAGTLRDPPADTGKNSKSSKNRKYGAMLNIGLPEGGVVSFAYMPIPYVRLNAGLGLNGISPGLNVGVTGLPLGRNWGPSLSVDYGHYFEGDASGLVEAIAGPSETDVSPMTSVGYDYVNFRLGMEVGGDRLTFFGRGGVSWIRTEIHKLNDLFEAETADSDSTTSISITEDPVLSVWAPSLTFGMIVRL